MLISDLEQLGLSEEEAKVYIAVLELGSSYVSAIAKKAGAHRVGCYHTLDNLVRKGVISTFTQNKIRYFAVESPKILVNQMEERFLKAKKLLPELLSVTNVSAYKPKIQYYEGLQGIKNIFEDTLTAQDEILGYTNLSELPGTLTEEYLRDYAKRKLEKGIKTRMLSPISKNALKYTKTYYPKDFDRNLVEIFFINPKEFMFEYEINIYGDKVSLVSLNPDELIGLIIESPLYAKTQRSVFNLAWLGATSFVAR
jgi:sugar-specific transcriptional regulator TrmB